MKISGKRLVGACGKTVRADREKDQVKKERDSGVLKMIKGRGPLRDLKERWRFEAGVRSVLKSGREKTNGVAGKTFGGRGAAAGRQIDFASLCDAGGFGGGDERTA